MALAQLNFEGKNKIEVAIDRIKQYAPPEGYYLGFSGGKDSVVIYDLALRAKVAFCAYYNVSPIDPPEIREFMKQYYSTVIWERHARGFWKRFLTKGPPMRHMRWCCGLIKEAGGAGRVKLLGMRRAESVGRRHYSLFQPYLRCPDTYWFLPIVDWTDDEVWEYINSNALPSCALYKDGFKRIGCILCPFESANTTARNLERFPQIAKVWRLAFERYWQIRIERGTPLDFSSSEEYWRWWLTRK